MLYFELKYNIDINSLQLRIHVFYGNLRQFI